MKSYKIYAHTVVGTNRVFRIISAPNATAALKTAQAQLDEIAA